MVKQYFSVDPWPWQERGVENIISLYRKTNSICLQSPTGGGKSKCMWALTRWGTSINKRVGILTNRNSLCKQLHRDMNEAGISHGIVASKMKGHFRPDRNVQLMMVQSEVAASKKRPRVEVDLLIVDEAHMFQTGTAAELIQWHKENGAMVVQVSATPIGLSRTCDEIVIAGTNSELRQHGAHVPCLVRAPCEFDCSDVKRTATGEFKVGDVMRRVWNQQIVGHVFDDWKNSNPSMESTIVFGPDCASSLWLAKEFEKRGVPVAHVEASNVYWDGAEHKDPDGKKREMIFDLVRCGEIPVLFNRFVCREGLDFPNLKHAILATPIGSLKSFIQTVGRVLRYSKQTPDSVLLTDHGGNCYRHGSPNADRDWEQLFRMTEEEVYKEQKKKEADAKLEDTPIICPKCKQLRAGGAKCPNPPHGCGHECESRQRFIIQSDGQLKPVSDKQITKKPAKPRDSCQAAWDNLYWSQKKGGGNLTFSQLRHLFMRQKGFYPPDTLLNMPKDWSVCGKSKVKETDRSLVK